MDLLVAFSCKLHTWLILPLKPILLPSLPGHLPMEIPFYNLVFPFYFPSICVLKPSPKALSPLTNPFLVPGLFPHYFHINTCV